MSYSGLDFPLNASVSAGYCDQCRCVHAVVVCTLVLVEALSVQKSMCSDCLFHSVACAYGLGVRVYVDTANGTKEIGLAWRGALDA